MRFRHKLSIVFVGLAIVPLAATGVLVGALLQHDQVTRVDNRLSVAVASAAQGYGAQLQLAKSYAAVAANNPAVRFAFTPGVTPVATDFPSPPPGMTLVLVHKGRTIFGSAVRVLTWHATAFLGPRPARREVKVYVHLSGALTARDLVPPRARPCRRTSICPW